ncbi:hypothetical protein FAVG1_01637 [Fusarium avenaceum]|nr:hypothetical protein FAVG1_01637 [Fusarium avenaceum]
MCAHKEASIEFSLKTNKNLVLIVGECLKDTAEDLLGDSPKQRVTEYENFDIKVHACIETRDTAIVVQRLQDKNAQFYVLQNKRDGLCELRKLPQMKFSHTHLVFYSEFVDGSRLSDKAKERDQIQKSILTARSEFVETLPKEAKEPSQPDEEILPPATLTAIALGSGVMEAPASRNGTGSGEALDQVSEVQQKAVHGSISVSDELDDTTENQLQQIRRLGEGDMTLASAQSFIAAYKKKLWSRTASSMVDIVPEAIIELDAGIHEGSLSSTPTIPDGLYQNFVSIFCGLLSWSKAMGTPAPREKAVAHAYQMAIRGTSDPLSQFTTAAPIESESTGGFIESMEALTLCLARTGDAAVRATAAHAANPGHSVLPMMSGSSLRAAAAQEVDLDRTNAILNSITQRESVENSNPMQLMSNMLWATHDLHLRAKRAHEEAHGKAASNPTQQVSDDVEMEDVGGEV